MLFVTALLILAYGGQADAHGISPQRMIVDSGTKTVVAQLTAVNNYKQQDRFSVECFKGDLNHKWPCQAIPQMFVLSHRATKKIKVKLDTDGDDVYLVCTIEEPDELEQKAIVTRVCSRIGVGVDPNPRKLPSKRVQRRPAANAVAAGSGQNTVR